MSSLAAARADNFYYPPTFDPKHGGINKQQGQHPLRERAKKLDQGILVIRFEMPFNVWCNGCGHLIGKGVRFNAEKKQVGSYFTTRIWNFSMTAPCCGEHIEVETDPKNTEYIVVAGGRRKAETWTAADAETHELPESQDASLLDDPFYKLEHKETDKKKGRVTGERVAELYFDSKAKYEDDYSMNKALRRRVRVVRKAEKQRDEHRQALGMSSDVVLLPESAEDAAAAAAVQFGDQGDRFAASWQQKRRNIRQQSIFPSPSTSTPGQSKGRPGALALPSAVSRPAQTKRRRTSDLVASVAKRQRMDSGVKFGFTRA